MRQIIIMVLFIAGSPVFSQHLNSYGHIIENIKSPHYKVKITNEGPVIFINDLALKGNSVFELKDAYLTLSGADETSNSILRIYTKHGKEIFSKSFKQTINFTLSSGKSFCAFHDTEDIYVLNLNSYLIQAFKGSTLFAIDDAGNLAYYDKVKALVYFNNYSFKLTEKIYHLGIFNGKLFWSTKHDLYILEKDLVNKLFEANDASIFEIKAINESLILSIKQELKDAFLFRSYISDNLINFRLEDEIYFPLASKTNKLKVNKYKNDDKLNKKNLANELIRNPLQYYNDTVFQAVGNTNNELQDYGSPYLHPGVDLMGDHLQDVYSVKDGVVKAILSTSGAYHWRIAIANQDVPELTQGYVYAHIDNTTFPYMVGDHVNEGDIIGKLVDFPVDGFVHCHFARILGEGQSWNGNWTTIDNPLNFMSNFFDSIPPQFENTINGDKFAFRNKDGDYISPDSLFGELQVISKVHDRLNSSWKCEIDKISYNISPLDFPEVILLDSFSFDYGYINDFYSNGPYYYKVLNTIYSRDSECYSLSDYEDREYYHIITNSDGNDTITNNDKEQLFNTLSLPNGSYIFRVKVSDPSGNISKDSMIIRIKNLTTTTNNSQIDPDIIISPNPFISDVTIQTSSQNIPFNLVLRNATGQLVYKQSNINSINTIDLSFLANGVYFMEIDLKSKKYIRQLIKQ